MKAMAISEMLHIKGLPTPLNPKSNTVENTLFSELLQGQMKSATGEQPAEKDLAAMMETLENILAEITQLLSQLPKELEPEAQVTSEEASLLSTANQQITAKLSSDVLEKVNQLNELLKVGRQNQINISQGNIHEVRALLESVQAAVAEFRKLDTMTPQDRMRVKKWDTSLAKVSQELQSYLTNDSKVEGPIVQVQMKRIPLFNPSVLMRNYKEDNGLKEGAALELEIPSSEKGNVIFSSHFQKTEISNSMPIPTPKVPMMQLPKFLEPIILKSTNLVNGVQVHEVTLQLQPESLGKLNVHIQSHSGQLTAQFVVENATAKQAVEDQLTHLRQSLISQGISVQNIEVVESPSSNNYQLFQQQQRQQQQEQRPFVQKEKKGKEYVDFDEELNVHRDFIQNSSASGINYIV